MKKSEKYITHDIFIKENKSLHSKIDSSVKQLKTITSENSVKLDRVINQIDHFVKRGDVYDKKAIIEDYRLSQLETKVQEHDQRPSTQGR